MAAPVAVGHTETFGASGTTCVITLTAAVPAGAKLFVLCGHNVNAGTISSVVDSRSNSYTTDVSKTANQSGCFLLRSDVTTALQVSDTITVTFGQSTTNRLGSAAYKTGLATGGPDKTATGSSAGIVTAAGWSSGTTATTTQPDEFVIGGVIDNDSTLVTSTVVAPNTELTDAGTSDGVSLVVEYQDLVATGTPKIDGTFSVVQSKQWDAVAATYKVALAAVGAPLRPLLPMLTKFSRLWLPPFPFPEPVVVSSVVAYEIAADPGSYAVAGVATSTVADRLVAAAVGSYAVSGIAAQTVVGYWIAGGTGSYTVTGTATATLADRTVGAAPGFYAITGFVAAPVADRFVGAASGAYAVSGVSALLCRGLWVAAAPGSYSTTGTAAGLLADRLVGAATGAYAINGVAASLVYGPLAGAFVLDAASGGYTVAGTAAAPVAARILSGSPGSYAVSGVSTVLAVARMVAAAPGVYALTGSSTQPVAVRFVAAVPGSYSINGTSAVLVAVGAVVIGSVVVSDSGATASVVLIDAAGATVALVEAAAGGVTISGSTSSTLYGSGRYGEGAYEALRPMVVVRDVPIDDLVVVG